MKYVLLLLFIPGVYAACNQGAIWTTDAGCGSQDLNQYAEGDEVWIAGDNFCAGTLDYSITGQPGKASCTPNQIIAQGQFQSTGDFCFKAHTIESDECGQYKVLFDGKQDTYGVDSPIPEFATITALVALAGGAAILYSRRK